jgi:hypothetical protein
MYCMSDVEIDFSVNTPTVAHESIDGEVIVINLISGNYYSLEGTGAEIWESIDGGYSLPKITALLADRYTTDAVSIAPIIDRFVAELRRASKTTRSLRVVRRRSKDKSAIYCFYTTYHQSVFRHARAATTRSDS